MLAKSEACTGATPNLALKDMSRYELIMALADDGWSWSRLPRQESARAALTYVPGSDKLWYTAGTTVLAGYLRCLLDAEVSSCMYLLIHLFIYIKQSI